MTSESGRGHNFWIKIASQIAVCPIYFGNKFIDYGKVLDLAHHRVGNQ